jgi:putative metallohydrolase (TIGR04338 family)
MNCSCQQYELYASQALVPHGREFTSEAELQSWLDDLTFQPWWQRFYPQVIRVEAGFRARGKCSAGAWFPRDYGAGRIEMLPGHRNELIVCHELAHVLAAARFGSKAHCPWFARVYLELVYLVMGHETWTTLRKSFIAGGIDFSPDPEPFDVGRRREVGAAA